ncbi:hypothetical protein L7F22_004222 [Adiantum nelumboides]|nr:hypothetical protein [Adiantum nelumboides]
MVDNNKENRMSIDDFDFAHEDANDDTSMLVNYLVTRLHQAMGNPALQGEVQQQLHAYGILPPIQQERGPERFQSETSKRGLSAEKRVENPFQELKQLLEDKPSSKKKGHAQHERSPSREREESESSDKSMEDVAPRRRRAQRSPTPTKQKRSPHIPHCRESKREEKNSKKKKERKRSPSSPSSSPSFSSDEGSGYSSQERQRRGHQRSYAAWKRSSKLKKFKEGGKNISFLTYDGTFGATDKVLAFIQQFDAAFGDEGFTESSKLHHGEADHEGHVRKVLEILRQHQLYTKESKCTFCSPQVSYLGFIISADGISVDPEKIKDIVEWPQPTSVSKVRGFLGITGWYRIFVKDYALIAAPLTSLLKKGMPIDWKAELEASFSELKGYLVSSPILKLPNFSKEFEVVTDASGLALGGVLTQEERPVAYTSRKLRDHERNYPTHDLELLAVIHALKLWRHYLLSRKFQLVTDHKSLKWIFTQPNLNMRQRRWIELLQEYDFDIKYRPGKDNVVADGLSRKSFLNAISIPNNPILDMIKEASLKDPEYQN